MNIFTKEYYEAIWPDQGVHRHDYCEGLANQLIAQYGKCRTIDIGAGCGYLVKTLREKDCDAWGLELSDYALQNTCAPGYIIKGSVVDIPFKDNSFSLVFSQGLWEYVKEEEIQRAWMECQRVGKQQEHNIDTTTDTAAWTRDFITHKSEAWWKEKLQAPKVLVACPNHEVKEYSFQRWIDCVRSLTYPNYDILVVDNSPTEDFMNRYKDQIPMQHIPGLEQGENAGVRICTSMEEIRKTFLEGKYDYWLNLESDVIPPPYIIEYLLDHGKDADWISHGYPTREGFGYIQGIGCSLFNRKIIEENDFISGRPDMGGDGNFWDKIWRQGLKYKTVELYFFLNLIHLKE